MRNCKHVIASLIWLLTANVALAGSTLSNKGEVKEEFKMAKFVLHKGTTDEDGCHRDPNGKWHCH